MGSGGRLQHYMVVAACGVPGDGTHHHGTVTTGQALAEADLNGADRLAKAAAAAAANQSNPTDPRPVCPSGCC
jgi:hypothetical protein